MVSANLEAMFCPFWSERRKLKQEIEEAGPYIAEFCKKYDLNLLGIFISSETGELEPSYVFNNGLGQYTLQAIKDSLGKE